MLTYIKQGYSKLFIYFKEYKDRRSLRKIVPKDHTIILGYLITFQKFIILINIIIVITSLIIGQLGIDVPVGIGIIIILWYNIKITAKDLKTSTGSLSTIYNKECLKIYDYLYTNKKLSEDIKLSDMDDIYYSMLYKYIQKIMQYRHLSIFNSIHYFKMVVSTDFADFFNNSNLSDIEIYTLFYQK